MIAGLPWTAVAASFAPLAVAGSWPADPAVAASAGPSRPGSWTDPAASAGPSSRDPAYPCPAGHPCSCPLAAAFAAAVVA